MAPAETDETPPESEEGVESAPESEAGEAPESEEAAEPELVPDLLSRMGGKDPIVRMHMIDLLAKLGGEGVAEAVADQLQDNHKLVRRAALTALASLGVADNDERMQSEHRPQLRSQVIVVVALSLVDRLQAAAHALLERARVELGLGQLGQRFSR